MSGGTPLTKLNQWLEETGHKKSWFANAIGYSRRAAWHQRSGLSALSDRFVVACFRRFPELPYDTFADHGYVRDGDYVYRRIPLHEEIEPSPFTTPAIAWGGSNHKSA